MSLFISFLIQLQQIFEISSFDISDLSDQIKATPEEQLRRNIVPWSKTKKTGRHLLQIRNPAEEIREISGGDLSMKI
jgi:hypothetical protein